MPILKLTNLAAYRAYFQDIATGANHHKQVNGYKWGDKDVIMNDSRSDLVSGFLWAMPYERTKYEDRNSDNIVKIKKARVAYMIVPDGDKFSDEDAAFDFCETVVEEILAKILVDKRGSEVAGVWTMLSTRVEDWTTGPVEHKIGSTKYIGWEFDIPFLDNTKMDYDASKWN